MNFYWIDGTENDYENWAKNEPNDEDGTETCVEVIAEGTWNDYYCHWSHGYVCKMNKSKLKVLETYCLTSSHLLIRRFRLIYRGTLKVSSLTPMLH